MENSYAPPPAVTVSASSELVRWLSARSVSLAFTSYQSGLLYCLGVKPDGQLNIHQTALQKPMGLCRDGDKGLIVSNGAQIIRFQDALEPGQRANNDFDACFLPRRSHFTGALDTHDIGLTNDGALQFVNTSHNCIACVSESFAFEPIWKPPFISRLVREDRCHLNGMALRDGVLRYVTAVSASDTIDGWRDRRASGGIVMDITTDEIIATGLSMPHSPRWHNGHLWLLNSGTGELGYLDMTKPADARFTPIAFCPGFTRGLSFTENFAVVGLSKPRHQRFEGLALDQRLQETDSEPWCGLQVINLQTGSCTAWFRIDGSVNELYDVLVLPGLRCPMVVSPHSTEAEMFTPFPGA